MPTGHHGVYRYPNAENEIHFCACGCGKQIIYKQKYRYRGYPKYLCGHALKGRTKDNDSGIARMAEKLQGRTAETHSYLAMVAEKLRGRTKENNTSVAAQAKKMRGRTKENNTSVAAQAKKMRGRKPWNKGLRVVDHLGIWAYTEIRRGKTKENDAGYAATSRKLKGRTKETDTGLAVMAEKLRGRTKENYPYLAVWAEKARQRIGKKSATWRGGISFESYTPAFNKALKESIRKRDNYSCQLCGVPECECIQKLTTHHIDYIKAHSEPFNLIALCKNCNSKVNCNRSYWTKYFQVLISSVSLKSEVKVGR